MYASNYSAYFTDKGRARSMPKNEISDLTRRAIVDYLIARAEPFHGRLDRMEFLRRVWPLSEMPSEDPRFENAEDDIWQHTVNNHDWEDDYLLFNRLQIETCDDATFLCFVETCISPRVIASMNQIDERVDAVNLYLARDGYRLSIAEHISGWPLYRADKSVGPEPVVPLTHDVFPFAMYCVAVHFYDQHNVIFDNHKIWF